MYAFALFVFPFVCSIVAQVEAKEAHQSEENAPNGHRELFQEEVGRRRPLRRRPFSSVFVGRSFCEVETFLMTGRVVFVLLPYLNTPSHSCPVPAGAGIARRQKEIVVQHTATINMPSAHRYGILNMPSAHALCSPN